jgi:hypothetical protein
MSTEETKRKVDRLGVRLDAAHERSASLRKITKAAELDASELERLYKMAVVERDVAIRTETTAAATTEAKSKSGDDNKPGPHYPQRSIWDVINQRRADQVIRTREREVKD